MNSMWPQLFVVGAMKAGTTTIANSLSAHPDIFVCPVKEPNFFCFDLYEFGLGAEMVDDGRVLDRIRRGEGLHYAYIRNPEVYLRLFDGASPYQFRADCSTSYLYSCVSAKNIRSVIPKAKIVITLRNPVERAFSEFLMNVAIGTARWPFRDMLMLEQKARFKGQISPEHRYVTAGLYYEQVKRYIDEFGRDNVLVLRFENIRDNVEMVMSRVWTFLELKPCALPVDLETNKAKIPRFPRLNCILQESGLKSVVRKSVPRSVKEMAKSLFYSNLKVGTVIDERDAKALLDELCPDIEKLSEFLEEDFTEWLQI